MTLTMDTRGPRIALIVLVVLAQAAAASKLWTTERQLAGLREAARAFETDARDLAIDLVNLRAAQQAYVAAGQGEEYWTGRAASLFKTVEAGIAGIRRLVTSPEAGQALGAAADLLDAFRKTDDQAREHLRLEQKLLASDLVFGESAESTAACAVRIGQAASLELAARERQQARLRMAEAITLGVAAGIILTGLLLLLPRGRMASAVDAASAVEPAEAPVPEPLPASQAEPLPDLAAVAVLCNDFSRVGEATALQPLIERSASILDATGVIVWMANPATNTLQPVLSHGYSAQALSRIGDLARDADNAAAEAFRTGELRVVEGDGRANGAIVTPLVTPAGCVGVLAAEIRSGGETGKASQAVAAIFAAQLASLVSSSPGTS